MDGKLVVFIKEITLPLDPFKKELEGVTSCYMMIEEVGKDKTSTFGVFKVPGTSDYIALPEELSGIFEQFFAMFVTQLQEREDHIQTLEKQINFLLQFKK